MILARRRAFDIIISQGIVPKQHVLDNEILAAYRKEIRATHMTFQLVPPYDYRCNLADKAIQTQKDHLIFVMSGTAVTLLVPLWCQAIPQADQQLLILQK